MELSSIQKNANRSELFKQLDIFAELNASKVALWQKQETDRLLDDPDNVYIIPVKNGFKVGRSAVYEKPIGWVVTCKSQKKKPFEFNTKNQALLYAVLTEKGYDKEADEYKQAFLQVQKHVTDIQFYKHNIKAACNKKDYFKQEALENRLDDSMYRLELAKNNFEKSIKSAKYIKLRDNEK